MKTQFLGIVAGFLASALPAALLSQKRQSILARQGGDAEERGSRGTGGSSVAFRHYRDDDLTVVVLTNLQGIDPDALCDGIAGLYFGG